MFMIKGFMCDMKWSTGTCPCSQLGFIVENLIIIFNA